jgi:hypothetical protein
VSATRDERKVCCQGAKPEQRQPDPWQTDLWQPDLWQPTRATSGNQTIPTSATAGLPARPPCGGEWALVPRLEPWIRLDQRKAGLGRRDRRAGCFNKVRRARG